MSKELDLEYQYQKYLKIIGLDEKRMGPVQRKETKRAYYGACGQILVLFRDVIGTMEDEDKAILQMEDLVNQVDQFWREESK